MGCASARGEPGGRAGAAIHAEQAAAIRQPVLSVTGVEPEPLWIELARFLHASLPVVADGTIEGAGHLLHIQRPEGVARVVQVPRAAADSRRRAAEAQAKEVREKAEEDVQ
jgi:pimeloyl-ACP methyl ester carboxylesterase